MTGDTRLPAIDKELVDEFVLRAHGDFDFVQRTALGSTPRSAAKKRAKFSYC